MLFLLGSSAFAGVHVDSAEQPHLPTAVNAPGPWSSDEEVRWPVAALGISTRTEPVGLFGKKETFSPFAVSAVDGHASWIRTPGASLDRLDFAVSPDGRRIGWVRHVMSRGRPSESRVAGWSILDTTTGAIRRLQVPGFPWVRWTMAGLAFSGDSRYLLTSYETPDLPKASRSRGHQLVAWDVEDGEPTVIERPGPYSLPSLGSAPTGVTWARGRKVFRVDPAVGDTTTVTLPHDVITASWGPDDRSFAYIGRPSRRSKYPWRLYAGRTLAEARSHAVDLPSGISVQEVSGWRDPDHVVVGHSPASVHVVDVVTGAVESLDLSGDGEDVYPPSLAAGLWQQPLAAPVERDGTTDPRTPWRWLSGAMLVLFAGALLILRRRRGRVSRTHTGQVDPVLDGSIADPPSLRPLATAAKGMLVVLVDYRVDGVDLIPDPLGWVIVAWGLGSLAAVHRGFHVAAIAAWLAVVPSLPEWVGIDGTLIASALGLAMVVIQFATCSAIMDVSPAARPSASAVRRLTLGLGVALALAIAVSSAEPNAAVSVLAVGLALVGVLVWFLVLLFGVAKASPANGAQLQPA